MAKSTSKDLRFRKTEEAIRTAFLESVQEGSFEKLTVKDLAAEANIDRKTFYLHYDSLQDLIAQIQDGIAETAVRKVAGYEIPGNIERIVRVLFGYWSSLPEPERRVYAYARNHSIGTSFSTQMRERGFRCSEGLAFADQAERDFLISFVVDSIASLYTEWLRHPGLALDQAAHMASKLILHGIESCQRE